MTQILDALPPSVTERITCCYINQTRHIEVVRIENVPNWYFERVVFPGERLLLEAVPEAHLDVYAMFWSDVIVLNRIRCIRLKVKETQTQPNYKVS